MSSIADKWEANRHYIARLYVDQGLSYDQIAFRLAPEGLVIRFVSLVTIHWPS